MPKWNQYLSACIRCIQRIRRIRRIRRIHVSPILPISIFSLKRGDAIPIVFTIFHQMSSSYTTINTASLPTNNQSNKRCSLINNLTLSLRRPPIFYHILEALTASLNLSLRYHSLEVIAPSAQALHLYRPSLSQ